MSVAIYLYVAPEPSAITFLPSAEQIASVIDMLAADGWIGVGGDFEVRTLDRYETVSTGPLTTFAQRISSRLVKRGSVHATAPGPPTPPDLTRDELDEDFSLRGNTDLVLLPDYCYQVDLMLTHNLSMIPIDMNGSPIDCPVCGQDVTQEPEDQPSKASYPYFPSLETCMHCGAHLEPETLTSKTPHGRTIIEDPAPFYRFAVALYPNGTPDVEGELIVDPDIADRLEQICRVEFRYFTRWG